MATSASSSSIVRSLPLSQGDIAVGEVVSAGTYFEIYLDGALIGRAFGQDSAVARLDAAMQIKATERAILGTMHDALFNEHRAPVSVPTDDVELVPNADAGNPMHGECDEALGEGSQATLTRPPRRIRIEAFRASV